MTDNNMPNILIWIIKNTLTDGSSTFDVDFNGTLLECISEDDANDLAQTIADAINQHTNDKAIQIALIQNTLRPQRNQ